MMELLLSLVVGMHVTSRKAMINASNPFRFRVLGEGIESGSAAIVAAFSGVPPGNMEMARDEVPQEKKRALRRMRNAAGKMPTLPIVPLTPPPGRESGIPAKS